MLDLVRLQGARVVELSIEVEPGTIMGDLELSLVNSIDFHVARLCTLLVVWETPKDTRAELEVVAVSCNVP